MAIQTDITPINVNQLLFDWENPRLPTNSEELDIDSQDSIFDYIQSSYSLRELGQSLADNGYFREEPLQVVSHEDKFRVVEGNRRLAALKLLTDPEVRSRLPQRRRELWEEFASTANLSDLKEVPAVIHSTRDELLNFLGFRHISGVRRWRAEAKARYLTQLMRSEHLDFSSTARRIGSQAPAVRRQTEAFTVLEQASEADLPTEGAERYFGLFYNALQDPGIRKYLGLPASASITALVDNPIPENKIENLERMLRWLFGADGRKRIITESRDISRLGSVLHDELATRTLESRGDLDSAVRIAGGDRESFETSLREARLELLSANGQAFQWAGDQSLAALVSDIQDVLNQLIATIQGART